MRYKQWKLPAVGNDDTHRLTSAGYTPLLSQMLCRRGLSDPAEAERFLSGGEETLCSPLLMRDMDSAARRVNAAIAAREKVAVFGDYDVDGITSACMVTSYLRLRGLDCTPYIPDRMEEGYGLNMAAIDTIKAMGVSLIITVDCGITAREEADYAASLGMDMVITDHHECGTAVLPRAAAVVDPKRPDCEYPSPELAGVGVAFKLLCAVSGDCAGILELYADLIATGTVADVMPLRGENRYIVQRGLKMLANDPRPGLKALLEECGAADKRITATTLGFSLAPRINAAGRLGKSEVAVALLLTEDPAEASRLAAELCRLNRERQELEGRIFDEARETLLKSPPTAPIVLASESWHQGVIGIAASKLAEEFSLPVVMICLDGDVGKGSCRSCGGFNLFEALTACSDCLLGFGGHALAAGLSLESGRVDEFRAALERYYKTLPEPEPQVLEVDLRVEDPSLLSMECVESLDRLEPFGTGNPKPVLCICDAELTRVTPIGMGRHLRMTVAKAGYSFESVLFVCREEELGAAEGDRVDIAFYPQINDYRGRRSVQLVCVDIRKNDPGALCRLLMEDGEPGAWECSEICPARGDFVRVWRWAERSGDGGVLDGIGGCGPDKMHPGTFFVCLRVMRDLGLVELEHTESGVLVRALPQRRKADLEAHPLMVKLKARRRDVGDRR